MLNAMREVGGGRISTPGFAPADKMPILDCGKSGTRMFRKSSDRLKVDECLIWSRAPACVPAISR